MEGLYPIIRRVRRPLVQQAREPVRTDNQEEAAKPQRKETSVEVIEPKKVELETRPKGNAKHGQAAGN